MVDQTKQAGQAGQSDPQAQSQTQQGQQGQQGGQQEDEELTDYLKQEEGHTDDTAKAEIKKDREGVKQRHRKHKEKHGSQSHSSR